MKVLIKSGVTAAVLLLAQQSLAFECVNKGQAAFMAAEDNGHADAIACGPGTVVNAANAAAIGNAAVADVANTVVLGSTPGVGLGTSYTNIANGLTDPLAPLHVLREDDTYEFLYLESDRPDVLPQDRDMMFLSNKGGIRFEFENRTIGTSWRFQAATGREDVFEIAKVGTGEIEFTVDAAGNAILAGVLFENSDVNSKQNIEAVDPEAILEKVSQLSIKEWEYKDSPNSRHIGPMAQDFYATFKTGDSDTKLATMDVGGVAIASIQALEARNKELEAKNQSLEERLALVEAALSDVLPKTAQN